MPAPSISAVAAQPVSQSSALTTVRLRVSLSWPVPDGHSVTDIPTFRQAAQQNDWQALLDVRATSRFTIGRLQLGAANDARVGIESVAYDNSQDAYIATMNLLFSSLAVANETDSLLLQLPRSVQTQAALQMVAGAGASDAERTPRVLAPSTFTLPQNSDIDLATTLAPTLLRLVFAGSTVEQVGEPGTPLRGAFLDAVRGLFGSLSGVPVAADVVSVLALEDIPLDDNDDDGPSYAVVLQVNGTVPPNAYSKHAIGEVFEASVGILVRQGQLEVERPLGAQFGVTLQLLVEEMAPQLTWFQLCSKSSNEQLIVNDLKYDAAGDGCSQPGFEPSFSEDENLYSYATGVVITGSILIIASAGAMFVSISKSRRKLRALQQQEAEEQDAEAEMLRAAMAGSSSADQRRPTETLGPDHA